jgi:hypothetical protein
MTQWLIIIIFKLCACFTPTTIDILVKKDKVMSCGLANDGGIHQLSSSHSGD